jgi:hypothetical protein
VKYLWLTLKHKWFVFRAGIRIGCPVWRLLTHDLSKLTLAELPHYQRQFFGKADDQEGFIRCWIHHQNRNDHHWEYWIPRTGHNRCTPPYPDNEPVALSLGAVKEMVADWAGASRAYEGVWPTVKSWPWWEKNSERILKRLHPDTRPEVLLQIGRMLSY